MNLLMEDGGVDKTAIDCRQFSQMASFSPLLTFLIFDLQKLDLPQIKSQTKGHTQMN